MSTWWQQKHRKKKSTFRPLSKATPKAYGKPRPTPTITKLTLLEEAFGDGRFEGRRYWFARWCHKNRFKYAPSGDTWEEVFKLKEGVTLLDYIKFAKENKLGEKYAIQDKSGRDNLQTKVRL